MLCPLAGPLLITRAERIRCMRATGLDAVLPQRALLGPGGLVASCLFPVSFPARKGRGCHPILKSRLHFPLQLVNGQLPRHASWSGLPWGSRGCGGSSCLHVVLLSVLLSSAYQLGQRQSGDKSARFAAASACLYLCTTFSCFY